MSKIPPVNHAGTIVLTALFLMGFLAGGIASGHAWEGILAAVLCVVGLNVKHAQLEMNALRNDLDAARPRSKDPKAGQPS